MSYSNFNRGSLKDKLGIELILRANLFENVPSRTIGEWLKDFLEQNLNFALLQATEKARSEFIIAPIFAELRRQAEARISIFSGWELNVDVAKGLTGRCDFLVSRSPYQAALEAPLVVAVEAKQQDFDKGTTQCLAEMVGARIFNERRGNPIREIYGIVTTGDAWRFLMLRENKGLVDPILLSLDNLEKVFGILWAMTFEEISPELN